MATLPGRNIVVGGGQHADTPEEYFNVRNPLRHYRSHGYRWLITAHNSVKDALTAPTVDDYTKFVGSDYSAGGIIVVNEFADTRISVSQLSWDSIASGINNVTVSSMGGTLALSEPFGVSMLASLRDWSERLGTTFVIQTVFAARVIFYGHSDDGTSERLSGYVGGDRPLLFTLGDFNASFTPDGVTYSSNMIPMINGSLLDGAYSPISSLASDKLDRDAIAHEKRNQEAAQKDSTMTAKFANAIIKGTPLPAHWQDLLVKSETVIHGHEGQPDTTPGTEDSVRTTYNQIKSGALKSGTKRPIVFRNIITGAAIQEELVVPDGKGQLSAADAYAYNAGLLFTKHYESTVQNKPDEEAEGLADSHEERERAAEVRCEVLHSINTIQDAFTELTRALNVAALEWFELKQKAQDSADNYASPLKYEYELRAEGGIGTYTLNNISPKTQQTLECTTAAGATADPGGPVNISFDPNATIDEIIVQILGHSKQVADAVDMNEQQSGKVVRKETSKVIKIRTMRIDQGKNKSIRIVYLVGLADSAAPRDPKNLSTAAAGIADLEFDYLYGNRYTDLLDFDMSLDFGNLMYAKLLGTSLGTGVAQSGDAKTNVSAVVASDDATKTGETVNQAASGSPFGANRVDPVRSQAFLDSISDAAQLQHSELTIKTIGDPFLCYDSMCDPGQYLNGSTPKGHYFTDPHRDPISVKLNIRYPVYYNPQDGQAGFQIEPFWYQKPYHLYQITNTFAQQDGFTQSLTLMFDPTSALRESK